VADYCAFCHLIMSLRMNEEDKEGGELKANSSLMRKERGRKKKPFRNASLLVFIEREKGGGRTRAAPT